MKTKNIRVLAILAALVLGLVVLFVCCGGIVFQIEPMFIKTIDKPDSGTGEVIV